MKTKLFKRIGLLGLSSLAAFTFMTNIDAKEKEEQCTTYTNYYFFSDVNNWLPDWNGTPTGTNSFQEYVYNSPEENGVKIWKREGDPYKTYFAPLKNNETPKDVKVEKICLKKTLSNGTVVKDPDCKSGDEEWTLERFYGEYIELDKSTKTEQFEKPDQSHDTSRYYEVGDATKYYDHGRVEAANYSPLANTTVEDLVKASFFPTKTTMSFDFSNQTKYIEIASLRYIKATDYNSMVEKDDLRIDFYDHGALAPALYKVTYKADCHESTPTPTYYAKIHYCIEKEDGTCIPATDIDKKATDYSKTELKGETSKGANDGDGADVKSHTIKNCKLKNAKDETVSYKITDDNFNYEVRYICKEETVNPKTGIALIIAAWTIGLGALGYSAYYFMNARKEENAEL